MLVNEISGEQGLDSFKATCKQCDSTDSLLQGPSNSLRTLLKSVEFPFCPKFAQFFASTTMIELVESSPGRRINLLLTVMAIIVYIKCDYEW